MQFTHYGDSFEVEDKPGASNVAYTGKTLGLHLDQPIYKNRYVQVQVRVRVG